MKIKHVSAREILDSRGNPTLEVEIVTEDGHLSRAAVPSGASTGEHEALELRDEDPQRYGGKGVLKAVANVADIAPKLLGLSVLSQKEFDTTLQNLDGTSDKSALGANTLLGISLAAAKAGAHAQDLPLYRHIGSLAGRNEDFRLPLPLVNIFNGGAHAVNSTAIQEFMIVPRGAKTYPEAIRWCSEVFHRLKSILEANGHSSTVGDEGGFAPGITSDEAVLTLITQAIAEAGYTPGRDIGLALDVAASEFYQDERYHMDDTSLDRKQMIDWLTQLSQAHPILSIEDGLDENDWEGWTQLTAAIGDTIQLVGDDLLVTNPIRLKEAVAKQAANAILIKPNQIGTLSETLEAIALAHAAGWRCVISHRSGETVDTTIAHLAVGTGAGQIKTGSMSRGERIEKYNELLRISEELASDELLTVL